MGSPEAYYLPHLYSGLKFHSSSEPPCYGALETPIVTTGTVIVKPLYSIIVQYANEIFANGNPRGYKYPLPITPGGSCIARIAAVPSDATSLKLGQLVFVELTVRSREDPNIKVLRSFHEGPTEATKRLMREWCNGSWAKLMNAPLESVHALDESILVEKLGYKIEELGSLSQLVVPYGGLSDVDLKAGETVLIAPATGSFSSAAVHVALAMGARVIAMGRNETALAELKKLAEPGRVETVKISGDVEEDFDALSKFGPIDVYFDISPRPASTSSHIRAGIFALRAGGRMSLMGGIPGDISLPYWHISMNGLTIKGTFMNTSQQAKDLIKLLERGVLKIGTRAGMEVVGKFRLEDCEEAFNTAAAKGGPGKSVYFTPNEEWSVAYR
ncbi:alcohol dehydrogenase GroES domain-containing protein [Annulohypoxylon truncatum]|uniref:alcohol dehydrogenase GroES domain-containing protein n=1 Tax=Annulohypoxylon truncatum TaxID=327061 RepID=UPI0020080BE8|nr:alcohol dehydrogenase GroES domain-containing protein [Annulohypoxylon truncatum]KAI1213275.1 alcohol dehydrogenase GroES domain-containing protein [Annulohypoxylon truncatum]